MKIISVGMAPGHLCPPYHRTFDPKRIKEFYDYIDGKIDVFRHRSAVDALDSLLKLHENEDELEIIGSYADACVASTINLALRLGIITHSPHRLLFNDKDFDLEFEVKSPISYDNFGIKAKLFQDIFLKENPEFQYLFQDNVHSFIPR